MAYVVVCAKLAVLSNNAAAANVKSAFFIERFSFLIFSGGWYAFLRRAG